MHIMDVLAWLLAGMMIFANVASMVTDFRRRRSDDAGPERGLCGADLPEEHGAALSTREPTRPRQPRLRVVSQSPSERI